jgi:hypothetical protein
MDRNRRTLGVKLQWPSRHKGKLEDILLFFVSAVTLVPHFLIEGLLAIGKRKDWYGPARV